MTPRVTVIIPTYNWPSVLPYSVGSALDQTFTDFEILVVGDGCTDHSDRVVAAIEDSRVRWINLQPRTVYQDGPNNEGLRQAAGEIVAYLGHDDLWLPHHLALAVAAIDEGADLVHSMAIVVDPHGRFVPPLTETRAGWIARPGCTPPEHHHRDRRLAGLPRAEHHARARPVAARARDRIPVHVYTPGDRGEIRHRCAGTSTASSRATSRRSGSRGSGRSPTSAGGIGQKRRPVEARSRDRDSTVAAAEKTCPSGPARVWRRKGARITARQRFKGVKRPA